MNVYYLTLGSVVRRGRALGEEWLVFCPSLTTAIFPNLKIRERDRALERTVRTPGQREPVQYLGIEYKITSYVFSLRRQSLTTYIDMMKAIVEDTEQWSMVKWCDMSRITLRWNDALHGSYETDD